ncbi:class II fructose-bisphosphatase [Alphaproteobacteria bacterium]|nr:class II fructose-bisphosphatase [Alphaproteobacteria bacterium]MDB2635955.1 class II fructose-bisphosphatase [Alphaproteobacteria bacterium]
MDRNLAIELVRVSEFAALAASKHIGRGSEKAADQAAVDAMRKCLNSLTISGTVVIGEGERDEAPMLYIGEEVGAGGPQLDIALDPLEGTTITANGGENAMAVIALAQKGGFLNAPDVYMKKISANTQNQKIISLQQDLKSNIKELAQFKKVNIEDLVICILNRERHIEDIEVIRSSGARIKMIDDGDVSAVIASVINSSNIDMYYGIGGAPEGVLAAAALQCLGGSIEGQLIFYNDQEILRAKKTGINDLDKFYSLDDLAHGDIMFSATGVTDGTMLKGIKITKNYAETHSIVMRSKTGTIRHINGEHNFLIKKLDY